MEEKKWGFWYAFFWLTLMVAIILSIHRVTNWFVLRFSLDEYFHQAFNALPPIGCVFLVCFIVKRMKSLTWVEGFKFLGFKRPNWRQIVIGFLFLLPIFVSRIFETRALLASGSTVSLIYGWLPYSVCVFFRAGIFEESIFRGFIFQCLRPGRSFLSAAALSGILWSLYHLGQLGYSSVYSIRDTVIFMFFPFVMAFPSAYLFERGENVIWGWMIVHLGWDAIELLNINDSPFYLTSLSRLLGKTERLKIDQMLVGGILLSLALIIPLVNWLLPKQSSVKSESLD